MHEYKRAVWVASRGGGHQPLIDPFTVPIAHWRNIGATRADLFRGKI